MNMLSKIKNKRLGLIELIVMGYDMYLKNLKPILIVFSATVLPVGLIGNLLEFQIFDNGITAFPYIFLYIISLATLAFILYPIYFMAVAMIIENHILGKTNQYGKIGKTIIIRFFPYLGIVLRYNINCFLRTLLFVIPGLIYQVNNVYFTQAFVLRDQRGKAAFQYSRYIVKGNWWRVFLLGFLNGVVYLIIAFGSLNLLRGLLGPIPVLGNPLFAKALSDILGALTGMGVLISSLLLFFNLDYQKR